MSVTESEQKHDDFKCGLRKPLPVDTRHSPSPTPTKARKPNAQIKKHRQPPPPESAQREDALLWAGDATRCDEVRGAQALCHARVPPMPPLVRANRTAHPYETPFERAPIMHRAGIMLRRLKIKYEIQHHIEHYMRMKERTRRSISDKTMALFNDFCYVDTIEVPVAWINKKANAAGAVMVGRDSYWLEHFGHEPKDVDLRRWPANCYETITWLYTRKNWPAQWNRHDVDHPKVLWWTKTDGTPKTDSISFILNVEDLTPNALKVEKNRCDDCVLMIVPEGRDDDVMTVIGQPVIELCSRRTGKDQRKVQWSPGRYWKLKLVNWTPMQNVSIVRHCSRGCPTSHWRCQRVQDYIVSTYS